MDELVVLVEEGKNRAKESERERRERRERKRKKGTKRETRIIIPVHQVLGDSVNVFHASKRTEEVDCLPNAEVWGQRVELRAQAQRLIDLLQIGCGAETVDEGRALRRRLFTDDLKSAD